MSDKQLRATLAKMSPEGREILGRLVAQLLTKWWWRDSKRGRK